MMFVSVVKVINIRFALMLEIQVRRPKALILLSRHEKICQSLEPARFERNLTEM